MLLYGLTHVIPGDPIRALFGFRAPPPELLAEIRARYGLDDPFYIQYLKFVRNALQGEFGYSITGRPVGDLIRASLPVSARLAAAAVMIQAVVGIALGVVGALRSSSPVSFVVRGLALVVVVIPIFVLAYLLLGWIGYGSNWLQPRGLKGSGSYVLPAVALAAGSTALTIRLMHTELRATLRNPYIHFAEACGLSPRRIVAIHALRAAVVPVVTFVAASAAQIIGGLIIVEAIFDIPGIGSLVMDAILAKDHNVIVGVLAIAVVFRGALQHDGRPLDPDDRSSHPEPTIQTSDVRRRRWGGESAAELEGEDEGGKTSSHDPITSMSPWG